MITFSNFLCLKKKSFKYFNLSLCSFFVSSVSYQNSLNKFINCSKIQKKKIKQKILSKKNMEFKVNTYSYFLTKQPVTLFFPKNKRPIFFFGLKHLKPKSKSYSKKINLQLQNLNFTEMNLFDLNRDLGVNPYFGGISRGFSKLLVKIQLKEYLNAFLRPKWYRLAKFQNFKLILLKKKKKTDLFSNMHTFSNLFNDNNFYFFYDFFIKKRWFLLHIFKNDKKI